MARTRFFGVSSKPLRKMDLYTRDPIIISFISSICSVNISLSLEDNAQADTVLRTLYLEECPLFLPFAPFLPEANGLVYEQLPIGRQGYLHPFQGSWRRALVVYPPLPPYGRTAQVGALAKQGVKTLALSYYPYPVLLLKPRAYYADRILPRVTCLKGHGRLKEAPREEQSHKGDHPCR